MRAPLILLTAMLLPLSAIAVCAPTPALVIGQNSKFAIIMQKNPAAQNADEKALVADFLKDYATANEAQAKSTHAAICADDKTKVTECLADCATLSREQVMAAPYISGGIRSTVLPAESQQAAAMNAKITAKWTPWLSEGKQ